LYNASILIDMKGVPDSPIFLLKSASVAAEKEKGQSCGASSKEKAKMGAAAPKPPHAIHPHSKLWGILAFSHECRYLRFLDNR